MMGVSGTIVLFFFKGSQANPSCCFGLFWGYLFDPMNQKCQIYRIPAQLFNRVTIAEAAKAEEAESNLYWLRVKNTGYLKNPMGKRKNRPKPVVPKGFLFDPRPYVEAMGPFRFRVVRKSIGSNSYGASDPKFLKSIFEIRSTLQY